MPRIIRISHRWLEGGSSLRDVNAEHVSLEDCNAAPARFDAGRPIIENVHLTDLRVKGCLLKYAIVRNVTIDGLTLDRNSGFCFGNQFERVTIRGRIKGGALVLNRRANEIRKDSEFLSYTRILADWDQGDDWTLDISQAEGEVEVRGYAADRIRLDPETQAIVRKHAVVESLWKTIDFETTFFRIAIEDLMTHDQPDAVLSANKSSPNLSAELRVLRRLRDEGIAE